MSDNTLKDILYKMFDNVMENVRQKGEFTIVKSAPVDREIKAG